MKKELKIVYPSISCFQDIDNPLGIMQASSGNQDFIYHHFINIYSKISTDDGVGSWLEVNFPDFFSLNDFISLDYCKIERNILLSKGESIVSFLINFINNGWHCNFFVDLFYVPVDKRMFNIMHGIHDIFVHGYDDSEKTFMVADYSEDDKFSFRTVTFEELENAYNSFLRIHDENIKNCSKYLGENSATSWYLKMKDCDLNSYIRCLKYNNTEYDFDIELVKAKLEDYYNSGNTVDSYLRRKVYAKRNFVFGMANYHQYFNDLECISRQTRRLLRKNYYIFYLHKKILTDLFRYLLDKKYISEDHSFRLSDMEEIEEKCMKVKNLTVRYTLIQDQDIIERVSELYKICFEKEKQLIPAVLRQLKC